MNNLGHTKSDGGLGCDTDGFNKRSKEVEVSLLETKAFVCQEPINLKEEEQNQSPWPSMRQQLLLLPHAERKQLISRDLNNNID